MLKKVRIFTAIAVIAILGWVEFSHYTAWPNALAVPETKRRIYHYVYLAAIALVGYWGFAGHAMRWLKQLWLLFYTGSFLLIMGSAVLYTKLGWPGKGFIDGLADYRTFICTPLPFLILFAVAVSIKRLDTEVINKA